MKRGQVSVFIVLSLVMLLTVSVSLYYYNFIVLEQTKGGLEQTSKTGQIPTLRGYVEQCIKDVSYYEAKRIAYYGGTYDMENRSFSMYSTKINNSYKTVPYNLYCDQAGYFGCINTIPTINEIEIELSDNIYSNLSRCIDLSVFEQTGYKIESENMIVTTDITLNQIIVSLNYPIKVSKNDDIQTVSEFQAFIDVPFGKLFELAIDIMNTEVIMGNFDQTEYISNYMDKYDDKITIFKQKPYPNSLYTLQYSYEDNTDTTYPYVNYDNSRDFIFNFGIQGEDTISQIGYATSLSGVKEVFGCCHITDYTKDYCYMNSPKAICTEKNGIYFPGPCTCNVIDIEIPEPEKVECFGRNCSSCPTTWDPDTQDYTGPERKHGESWCLYDSITNRGMDYAGSRHYKHLCIDGVEYSEECRDYREELCTQTSDSGFTTATCRINRWQDCTSCTTENCCENDKVRDCFWSGNDFGKMETKCHPMVSPGFKFWEGVGIEACTEANAFKEFEWNGGDPEWLNHNALACTKMGDCGVYRNILDDVSGNFFESLMGDDPNFDFVVNPDGYNSNYRHLERKMTINTTNIPVKEIDDQASIAIKMLQSVSKFLKTILDLNPIDFINPFSTPSITIEHQTFCGLYSAPPGANNCEKCNTNDPYVKCSEYRCKSLGTLCKFSDTDNTCEEGNSGDTVPPVVKLDASALDGYSINSTSLQIHTESYNGYHIIPPVKPYEILWLKLESNEPTQCKFDFIPSSMSLPENYMPSMWFGDMRYNETHEISLRIPPHVSVPDKIMVLLNLSNLKDLVYWFMLPEQLINQIKDKYGVFFTIFETLTGKDADSMFNSLLNTITEFSDKFFSLMPFFQELVDKLVDQFGKNGYYLFVKCVDEAGNMNENEFFIKLEISDAQDTTPPEILKVTPNSMSKLDPNIDIYEFELYTNEPSECKYSYEDVDYFIISDENLMECAKTQFDISTELDGSYKCLANINISNKSMIYFRCIDQPIETMNYNINLFKGNGFSVYGGLHPSYYNLTAPDSIHVVDQVLSEPDTRYIVNTTFVDFGIYTNEKLECRYSDNESQWFIEMTEKFKECESTNNIQKGIYLCRQSLAIDNGDQTNEEVTQENYSIIFNYGPNMDLFDNTRKNYFEFDMNGVNVLSTSALFGNATELQINVSNIELGLNMFGEGRCRWGESHQQFDQMTNMMMCETNNSYTRCEGDVKIPVNHYQIYAACRTYFNHNLGTNSKYYVKCRESESTRDVDRNANNESYEVQFNFEPPLKILEFEPKLPKFGSEINFSIKLNQNMTNDNYICMWQVEKYKPGYLFDEVVEDYTLKQKLPNLYTGNYSIYISCIDREGTVYIDEEKRITIF